MSPVQAECAVEVSTPVRTSSTSVDGRIPALDGLRGIAILLVLFGHSLDDYFAAAGEWGVTLFFVLSGYLVTRVMLRDEASGRFSFRSFYRRRSLRILPAFFSFLGLLFVITKLGFRPELSRDTWLASVLFVRNLIGGREWNTLHLWSLSLEEQFYLVWPVSFWLAKTKRVRLSLIGATVFLMTIWRWHWLQGVTILGTEQIAAPGGYHWRPDLRLDTMLIGAAFALSDWNWVRKFDYLLGIVAFCLWYTLAINVPALRPLDTPVMAFILAALVSKAASYAGSSPLTSRALGGLGTLSYSLYLWQQIFLGPNLSWSSLIAIPACAVGSYLLIERPFLRLKDGEFRIRTALSVAQYRDSRLW